MTIVWSGDDNAVLSELVECSLLKRKEKCERSSRFS